MTNWKSTPDAAHRAVIDAALAVRIWDAIADRHRGAAAGRNEAAQPIYRDNSESYEAVIQMAQRMDDDVRALLRAAALLLPESAYTDLVTRYLALSAPRAAE